MSGARPAPDEAAVPAPASLRATLLLAAGFALGYGWILFRAIANLVAVPQVYLDLGAPEATPWWLLVLGLALPIVFFAGALLLGRGRGLFDRALLLAAGLAAASATALAAVGIVGVLPVG